MTFSLFNYFVFCVYYIKVCDFLFWSFLYFIFWILPVLYMNYYFYWCYFVNIFDFCFVFLLLLCLSPFPCFCLFTYYYLVQHLLDFRCILLWFQYQLNNVCVCVILYAPTSFFLYLFSDYFFFLSHPLCHIFNKYSMDSPPIPNKEEQQQSEQRNFYCDLIEFIFVYFFVLCALFCFEIWQQWSY